LPFDSPIRSPRYSPFERPVKNKPKNGEVIAFPRVGGLHHRYDWRKAAEYYFTDKFL
jgi:hypothetical protein